jgi:predicted PP-loop superfamily ATPase
MFDFHRSSAEQEKHGVATSGSADGSTTASFPGHLFL